MVLPILIVYENGTPVLLRLISYIRRIIGCYRWKLTGKFLHTIGAQLYSMNLANA